jgi:exonuclease SbcD
VVNGDPRRRYSGAPLALTFAEAGRPKSVTLVDFFRPADPAENFDQNWEIAVTAVETPVFQRLERLSGDGDALAAGLDRLLAEGAEAWLEIDHTGAEDPGGLRERLAGKVARSGLEIVRLRDRRMLEQALGRLEDSETLAALDSAEVFRRCLAAHRVPEEERLELTAAHDELYRALLEEEEA